MGLVRGRSTYVAAFDLGTGGGRCAIYDLCGRCVGSSYRAWSYVQPDPTDPTIREFNPEYVWQQLCDAFKDALAVAADKVPGFLPDEIVAISVTSQREGIVLLDEKGQELYAGPNVDYRGRAYNRLIAERHGDQVYHKTGHWPEAIFAPGRLQWIRDHRPDIYVKGSKLLSISDWLLFRLSGNMVAEPTNAAETLLFSLSDMGWDPDLLEIAHISADLLPPVVPPGTPVGRLMRSASHAIGLPEGTLVVSGGADTQCSLLGSGVTEPGRACVVAGTTTPAQLVTAQLIVDPGRRTWTCPHVYPGRWVLEANARLTGLVFRWLRDSFYPELPPEQAEALMLDEAREIAPGQGHPFAFLGPVVSNVAGVHPQAGMILGLRPDLSLPTGRGQLIRAFMENMAYAIRANVDLLSEIAGQAHVEVVMCGGGSRDSLLPELLAAVLGRSVTVSAESEAASLGAAICAAVGAGLYEDFDQAIQGMVRQGRVVTAEDWLAHSPRKSHERNPYPELYRRWCTLYHQVYLPCQSMVP
ncbi:MAG: hypothetical protein H5T95_08280 [Firmicutes bacterium]|nr:hypothetical protein [Bacillota bacterium]